MKLSSYFAGALMLASVHAAPKSSKTTTAASSSASDSSLSVNSTASTSSLSSSLNSTASSTVAVLTSTTAALTASEELACATVAPSVSVSTLTVHDTATQTVFVTLGGNQAAIAAAKTTTTTAASKITPPPSVNPGQVGIAEASGKNGKTTTTTKAASGKGKTVKGGNKNNKGGKVKVVIVTVEHIKPVTVTQIKTKGGKKVTTTIENTITSTELITTTATAFATTITSVSTLDQPVTVTATVTENGQEVVKTTEILTQVVTVTSDVVAATASVSTVTDGVSDTATATDSAASATATDSVAATGTDSVATTATATDSAATSTATASSGDEQSSLTLDPKVIQTPGDGNPKEGQVASLASTNNFMNFCLTQSGVPITNGQQVKTGSCNPVPMGRILATDKMPSSVFINPPNFGTIPANQTFNVQMKIGNLVTGNFVNAQSNYYAAPATVDGTGTLVGHSHIVIELLKSFDQATPTNPGVFAFFKGLNDPAVGGVLTAVVTGGLAPGNYRMASINTASNHQPALVAVAQHGTLDAFSYFTVQQ